MPLALGTLNSTILLKPCKDSVAVMYSCSAIERDVLLPCLNARYVTTGPWVSKMLSHTVWLVGCSIVLSHAGFVISFIN